MKKNLLFIVFALMASSSYASMENSAFSGPCTRTGTGSHTVVVLCENGPPVVRVFEAECTITDPESCDWAQHNADACAFVRAYGAGEAEREHILCPPNTGPEPGGD